MDGGRVIAEGTPEELKRRVGGEVVETVRRLPTLDEVFLALTGAPSAAGSHAGSGETDSTQEATA